MLVPEPVIDGSLQHQRRILEQLWHQGLSGKALLQKHTQLVDAHLQNSFASCRQAEKGFSLLALGGYGRCELFPFSDIDLLLLYAPEFADSVNTVAEAAFYPLWDAGLEVGHGVRTTAACLADADKDFFFQVALLDARLITGSRPLYQQLLDAFTITFVDGQRGQFLQKMMDHRSARHSRFGQHSYMLEPHIKESRGGLRDIQAMLWTARVVFGLLGSEAMLEAGLLTEAEQQKFNGAWNQLIKIRNRLHYISGRKNDQLFFEHQEEMARAFQYGDSNGFLGVEHFMREVHGHMQAVAVTTDLFFEHVGEMLDSDQPHEDDQVLETGIEYWRGRIHLAEPELLCNNSLLMKVFLWAAQTGTPLHYRTRRLISAHASGLDDNLQRSRRLAKYFLKLLAEAVNPLELLETMLETGLLPGYIPEFAKVQSLSQHDIYHLYTVDIHLLHTVAELHKLKKELPNVFQGISLPHILFLAGLLHDIGKGHGRGHAEKGAAMAETAGNRLGLPAAEVECLVFLVRNHLFLSHTAHRRDLDDEELILQCARVVETPERLAMLYLLTVADARATGPNAWSDWKAALLLELYLKTALLLGNAQTTDPDHHQGAAWMRDKIEKLLGDAGNFDVRSLPTDYLLNFTPEEVAEQIRRRQLLKEGEVLVYPEERKDSWSLLLMTRDRPGLLARICGVLALHNLKILAAQIFTWPDGTAVDILNLASLVDEEYGNQDWQAFQEDLRLAVSQRVGLDHRLSRKQAPVGQAARTISRRPAQVELDNESSERFTIIEVYADDRTGLLYDITRTLSDFGINIHQAMIGSRSDQVVDVFYVQDKNNRKISDTALEEEIRQSLLFVVSGRNNK